MCAIASQTDEIVRRTEDLRVARRDGDVEVFVIAAAYEQEIAES